MIPKFRAWDVHEKKMFTNDQLIIWNGNVYANDNPELNVNNLKGWSIDEKYLMQSTRLKDIHGKEIYEGDLVRYIDGIKGITCPVKFIKEYACFGVEWRNGLLVSFEYLESTYTMLDDLEVVGNIYENLSLIC